MELTSFQNNLFSLLFLAVVVHSIFLSILIFSKSYKERGAGWLGAFMIPVSLLLLTYTLYLIQLIQTVPHLLGVFVPAFYAIGPLYYFFVRRSQDEKHQFRWYDLLHLIPLLYVIWEWLPTYTMSLDEKKSIIENTYKHNRPSLLMLLYSNRLYFFILIYVSGTYFWLKYHLQNHNADGIRTKWLIKFTRIFISLLILFILIQVAFWAMHWSASIMELVSVLIIALTIHILGYVVLGKDKILPEFIRPPKLSKYATSPLDSLQIAAIKDKIISFLDSQQSWLNPDFSIKDLSNGLNIPSHHISQALNEGIKKSFYDLICEYRIREIKQRLQSGDRTKYSIWGIASDCGFGSKSSFNRAFRKSTGMTPTDYLKSSCSHDFSSE